MKSLKLMALGIGICGTIFHTLGEKCWLCGSCDHSDPCEACKSKAVERYLDNAKDGMMLAEDFLRLKDTLGPQNKNNEYVYVYLRTASNPYPTVLIWYLTHLDNKKVHIIMPYAPKLAQLACDILEDEECHVKRISLGLTSMHRMLLGISNASREDMPKKFFKTLCTTDIEVDFAESLKKAELDMLVEMLKEEDVKISALRFNEFTFGPYDFGKFGESLQKNHSLSELHVCCNSTHTGVAKLVLGTHLNKLTVEYSIRGIDVLTEIHSALNLEKGMDLPPNFSLIPNTYRRNVEFLGDLIAKSKTLENIRCHIWIEGDEEVKIIASALIKNFIYGGGLYHCCVGFKNIGDVGTEALYLAVILNSRMVELQHCSVLYTSLPEISEEEAIVRAERLELITEKEAEILRQKLL